MECVAGDVERGHLGVADLDAFLVGALVEQAFDLEARLGGRGADQLDDRNAIGERAAAPVLRDVAEQTMLDPVPLRCARRIVVDMELEAGGVGELLQLDLPQPHTRTVRPAAVGRDRQLAHLGIALSAHALDPGADRGDSELGGISGDANADEGFVGCHIVDAIGHRLAQLLVGEIVHVDTQRLALGAIVGAAVLEVADQLLLLGIDRDDGLAFGLRRDHCRIDVLELRVAVGVVRAFVRLAVHLAREAEHVREQLADRVRADLVPHLTERPRQLLAALRYPPQRLNRRAQRRRLNQAPEVVNKCRIAGGQRLAAAALAPHPAVRQRPLLEVILAAIDGRARQPGDAGDHLEGTVAGSLHLARRPKPPTALVQLAAYPLPPLLDTILVNLAGLVAHADPIRVFAPSRYPPSQSVTPTDCDSFAAEGVLSSRLATSLPTSFRYTACAAASGPESWADRHECCSADRAPTAQC